MGIIKTFSNRAYLEYAKGKFDDWCVYLTQPTGIRYPPRDADYFSELKGFAAKYGVNRIYADYISIYNQTGKQVEYNTLQQITEISKTYSPDDTLRIDILFTILYMAMVAEEQKKNTRLGRRIKRLGIYYLFFENASIEYAVNFMRGMTWRDISSLCDERGF